MLAVKDLLWAEHSDDDDDDDDDISQKFMIFLVCFLRIENGEHKKFSFNLVC